MSSADAKQDPTPKVDLADFSDDQLSIYAANKHRKADYLAFLMRCTEQDAQGLIDYMAKETANIQARLRSLISDD